MYRHLFIIIAAFALGGCAEKLDDSGSPSEKGELERSYISVTLKADDVDTRASDDYEYGTDCASLAVSCTLIGSSRYCEPFS